MPTTFDPLVYTINEAAAALKVSTWTIYKLVREGKLTRVPHLHQCRIAKAEIERIVNERGAA